jgi:N-acetyltransferase
MWNGLKTRLEGRLVVFGPLCAGHEEGLFVASQHADVWTWTTPVGESREFFSAWFQDSLAASEAGTACVLVTIDRASGGPIGSTRYLSLRGGSPRP